MTIGEQSVNGIKPNLTGSFWAVIVVKEAIITVNKVKTDALKLLVNCLFEFFILFLFEN
jgi:hypothetical protein